MRFNDFVDDGQAQTGAAGLGSEEWGEKILLCFRGNPDAGVLKSQKDLPRRLSGWRRTLKSSGNG